MLTTQFVFVNMYAHPSAATHGGSGDRVSDLTGDPSSDHGQKCAVSDASRETTMDRVWSRLVDFHTPRGYVHLISRYAFRAQDKTHVSFEGFIRQQLVV